MPFNKKWFKLILKIIFCLLFMFLVIQFWGPAHFSVGAFELEASLKPWGEGRTIIHLPPMGKILAFTHLSPFDLHLTLKNIDLEKITEFVGTFPWSDFRNNKIFLEIKINMIKYLLSLLIISFLLGVAGILLWTRREIDKKEIFLGGLINFLVLLGFLLATFLSFNVSAFSKAKYQGALEAAPWVLTVLQKGTGVVESLGGQFTEIVDNISFLHKEIERKESYAGEENFKRVLHISDIHNNPAGFEFVRRIVETFHIDLIIDTGDLVDYGTSLEIELFEKYLTDLEIPYVFVPGNHDSPFIVEGLSSQNNIIVLEEGIVEAAGLKIAGISDPAASSTAMTINEDKIEETSLKLREIVSNSTERIDIIAAHNPVFFKYLRNNNHLLLGGHLHTPFVEKTEEYIEINAGTTGASGIRGFQNLEINFSLVILNFYYLESEQAFVPLSADLIKVKQFPLNFSFERFPLGD